MIFHRRQILFTNIAFLVLAIIASIFISSFLLSSPKAYSLAGINQQLSFEGKVVNSNGTNITDGNYNVEFQIWNGASCNPTTGSGCSAIWTEDYLTSNGTYATTVPVTFTSGTYQVNLGSICAFTTSSCEGNSNTAVNWNTYPLYLSINVGTTGVCATSFSSCGGGTGVMYPLIALTSSPYSFNSNELGGITSGGFIQTNPTSSQTIQPTTNVSSLIVEQNSSGSFGNDVFDVQGSGGSGNNFIQVQSTAANAGNVTVNALGSTSNLTLDAGSSGIASLGDATAGTINIGTSVSAANTITIGKNTKTSTLSLKAGGGTLNLSTDGADSNIIDISNSAFSANSKTYTINIGNPTSTGNTGDAVNTTIGPAANLTGGSVTGSTIIQAQGLSDTITASTTTPTDIVQTVDNTSGAFQIQNADGEAELQAGTLATADSITNYVADSEFALGSGACPLTDWSVVGSPTSCAQNTSTANSYAADTSLKLVTTSSSGQGIQTSQFTSSPPTAASGTGEYYTLSFYAEQTSGTPLAGSNLEVVATGGGGPSDTCTISGQAANTLNSNGFELVVCTLTFTSSTGITNLALETTGSNLTADTVYISNVQLQQALTSAGTVSASQIGQLNLRGVITSPVAMQTNANSSTAFQIQNAAGNTIFNVNTNNTNIETSTAGVTSDTSSAPTNVNAVLRSTNSTTVTSQTYTVGVAPHAVGNLMILTIAIASSSVGLDATTPVSGGGVSNWVLVNSHVYSGGYNSGSGANVLMYEGTVSATGGSTITVKFNTSNPNCLVELVNQEFSSALGANAVWGMTATGNSTNNDTTTAIPFPSLTSGINGGGIYYGYSFLSSTARVDPGTPGFHWYDTPVNNNAVGYAEGLVANTAYSPSNLASGNTYADSIGVIMSPTVDNSVGINGATLIAGAASSAAFQVQNAVGAADLNVDTANNVISLDTGNTGDISPWQYNSDSTGNSGGLGANVAIAANGYVYDVTGNDGGMVDGHVFYAKASANGPLGHMTQTTTPGTPLEYQGALAVNGYLYELGGYTGSAASSAVQYAQINPDGTLGAWQTNASPLPAGSGVAGASVVAANGYIYVMGGFSGTLASPTLSTAIYYGKVNADGTVSSWTTSANSEPTALRFASAVYVNGNILLIGGGVGSGNAVQTVYTASVSATTGANGTLCSTSCTNGYSNASLPNNPGAGDGRAYASAYVVNGYVYLVGGSYTDPTQNPQATTYYGQVNSAGYISSWNTSAQTLPQTEMWQGGVALNGYLYVLGGVYLSGTTITASEFYASTARIIANASLDLVGSTSADLSDGGDQSSGSEGGFLTAGDTNIVGSLQVADQADFNQGVAVNGNVDVAGQAVFRPTSNVTNAFEIQNSSGYNVLQGDTSSNSGQGQLVLGSYGHNNGDLEFLNSGGTADAESIVANTSPSNAYVLTLPQTLTASAGQCLQSASGATTSATTLLFGSCAGSPPTLQNAYTGSAGANPGITLATADGGVTIQNPTSGGISGGTLLGVDTPSGNLFTVADTGDTAVTSSDTTGTAFTVTGSSISSGNVATFTTGGSTTNLTSGNIVNVATASAVQTAGSLLNVSNTATLVTSAGSDAANLVNVSRNLTATITGGTSNVPTVDPAGTGTGPESLNNTSPVTSWSNNYTVAVHSNEVLLVQVGYLSSGNCTNYHLTSVTYNAIAMTLLNYNEMGNDCVGFYYLLAPTTGSAKALVVNTSVAAGDNFTENISAWYNVNQTTPFSTLGGGAYTSVAGSTSTSSLSASSAAGQVVFDWLGASAVTSTVPATTQSGQTMLSNVTDDANNLVQFADSYRTASLSSGNTTMGYSSIASGSWIEASVGLNPTNTNVSENVTSAVASITNNCTATSSGDSICADASNVLKLNQQYSNATGAELLLQSAGSGDMLDTENGAGTILDQITANGSIVIGPSGGGYTPATLTLGTGTGADPAGVAGAMYYNSTLREYRCYGDNGEWSACQTRPIDASYEMDEEFLGGATTTATGTSGIGSNSWTITTIGTACTTPLKYAGTGTTTLASGTRPGILTTATPATSAAGCTVSLGGASDMQVAAGEDIKASVAMSVNSNHIMRVGLLTETSSATASTTGVWWEADSGSGHTGATDWQYCYGTGAAATCHDSGAAINNSFFERLEIQVVSTTQINFYINGSAMTPLTGITLGTTTQVGPDIVCANDSGTAVTGSCFTDYYQLRSDLGALR